MFSDGLEMEIQDIRSQLTALKIEIKLAEKWIEKAKDSAECIQNMIFDMEDQHV